jgi:predicted site-specific integrase-resolvase
MPTVERTDLLTATELAKWIGVKPETIFGWHRKGRIPARRLSHKVLRFCLSEVIEALENGSRYEAEGGPR